MTNADPGERPPQRLQRPPSDRYAAAAASSAAAEPAAGQARTGSQALAVAFAVPGAVIGLMVFIALAGPFSFTSGLVIVAIFVGRAVGLSVRAGGGRTVTSRDRVRIALAVTFGWLVLAQVGAWLYALSEGGDLPILDYLGQVYGLLVPLEAVAAIAAAWWSAR